MIDPTKTTPEKLAEMNDSLIVDNNYLRSRIKELEATIAEHAAELESLRKDAERYRFLRAENEKTYDEGALFVGFDGEDGGDWIGCDLDSVIDAAIAAAPK